MLIGAFKDRVWCSTSTQGTGTYTSAGAVAGYLDLDEIGHGTRGCFVATNGTDFEIFYGTVSVGGTKTVSRDEIIRSTNSDNAVNWSTGTRDLFCVAPAQDMVLRNRTNVYEADQDLDGNYLILSPDGTYSLIASNSSMTFTAGSTTSLALTPGTTGDGILQFSDNAAASGPRLILDRLSASPAANDDMGQVVFRGRDSAGNTHTYGLIGSTIEDATNSSEDGTIYIATSKAGSSETALRIYETLIAMGYAGSGRNVTVGKNVADNATAGIELRSDGFFSAIRAGNTVGQFDRLTDDGAVLVIKQAGTTEGTVSVAGNTVTWGPFTGGHWSDGDVPEDTPLGTVLCAIDEPLDSPDGIRDKLPKVRISSEAMDKTVYGVFGGWMLCEAEMTDSEWDYTLSIRPWLADRLVSVDPSSDTPGKVVVKFNRLMVHALGTAPVGAMVTGPVEMGDLLMTSDIPGTAIVAPEGTDSRYILGKAFGNKEDIGVGLVRAVIWAG